MIPERILINRILEPVPQNAHVVPVSLPITSFGDPSKADVATLSINPSVNEFCANSATHPVLPIEEKRLVDREVLGIGEMEIPTIEQAREVLEGNHNYFQNRPYGWFNDLENWILNPLGFSYFDGSAAHLDLVQWATNPVWSNIPEKTTQKALIEKDMQFLRDVLRCKKYKLLLLNGRTVYDAIKNQDLFRVESEITIKSAGRSVTFWTGLAAETPFICWSRFIQQYVNQAAREAIKAWICDYSRPVA